MKLKDLSDLIIFDLLPLDYDPKKKVILTNLLHIDKHILPNKMCKIYTTKKIAERFSFYLDSKGYKGLKKDNIVYVEPYCVFSITIEQRRTFQMMFCESADISGNLMVLIKEDNKINYVYCGNFMDIRTAILNENFRAYFGIGPVEYLYLNLKRSQEDHESDEIEQIEQVFNDIEKILQYHLEFGAVLYIPLFGYEYFIHKITQRFPKRVALSSNFLDLFKTDIANLDQLCDSISSAKIILYSGEPNINNTLENYKIHKRITINIPKKVIKAFKLESDNYYYELGYSPEPSPFDLQLLTSVIKPKRIYGIVDMNNINSKVPKYLIDLRRDDRTPIKQQEQEKTTPPSNKKNKKRRSLVFGPLANKAKDGIYLDDSDSD